MDKFKGTRGPWFVSNEGVLLVRDESGLSIVAKYIGYPDDDEEVANANLIAAAPDLLEALQDLSSRAEIYVNTSKAKEAIAKALSK